MQLEEKRALSFLVNKTIANDVMEKLSTSKYLSHAEKEYILSLAIIFLKNYQNDSRYVSFLEFSYYIVLKYSLSYSDYKPLFDISISLGYYPLITTLSTKILSNHFSIQNIIAIGEIENFISKEGYTETLHQRNRSVAFLKDPALEKSYIAPTSFGKSSLIVEYLNKMNAVGTAKIAIIVPTKSLLMQTYQMVRHANFKSKILIHDEMYQGEAAFIAVFTQERALRLMNRKKITFDILVIDEAHNMLNFDPRSILLSRLISKNYLKNPKQNVVYLSPLIENSNSLCTVYSADISEHKIRHNIKEPEIYELTKDREIYKYNRFTGQYYYLGSNATEFEYISQKSLSKNFIYTNRPVNTERLALELCKHMKDDSLLKSNVKKLIEIMKNIVHKDFYLVECLKYGIIYLHGKLPDNIKEYLEFKFKELTELKYVVANSVILEGINLPIDNMFILNTRGLYGKELTNLIGRVNRLNTIFNGPNSKLEKLLPPIHFVYNKEHSGANANHRNKIKMLRSSIFKDNIENPTLKEFDISKTPEKDVQKINKTIENEKFILSNLSTDRDSLKQYLIEEGISNFYENVDSIISHLESKIELYITGTPNAIFKEDVLEIIYKIFIEDIHKDLIDYSFKRLVNDAARRYYSNFILIRRKQSLSENIDSEFSHFKQLQSSNNSVMYIGDSYGEVPYKSSDYLEYSKPVFVELKDKTDKELINIALIKYKIESDFVSYKLNKFIVFLFDYKIIDMDTYNKYIYGTTNRKKIAFTQHGLSLHLIGKIITDKQFNNIGLDANNNLIVNDMFLEYIEQSDDFYRFELKKYFQ